MTGFGALYNENEPYAVEWLRNLASAGHIVAGDVDPRDVRELVADDVRKRIQVHFFAGLGGWSYALRLAGWPDELPVWTGSCPCQPFSQSGKGKGFEDERHLWPAWFNLIRECRPPVVFGEQVASPAGLAWLDVVCADLEREGYAVGAADLCAAGSGAPHGRQRLFFVANANNERCHGLDPSVQSRRSLKTNSETDRRSKVSLMADAAQRRRGQGRSHLERVSARSQKRNSRTRSEHPGFTRDFWENCEWVAGRDGKARPIEPGTFPLAHGVPARVGKLRAYGNAIVPQVAATFIRAARYAMIEVQP